VRISYSYFCGHYEMSTTDMEVPIMKAMVVRELGGGWVEEDIHIADPIGQEVLVELKASGLCGSDQREMSHEVQYPPPAVLGYEIAGVMTAVALNVAEFA